MPQKSPKDLAKSESVALDRAANEAWKSRERAIREAHAAEQAAKRNGKGH